MVIMLKINLVDWYRKYRNAALPDLCYRKCVTSKCENKLVCMYEYSNKTCKLFQIYVSLFRKKFCKLHNDKITVIN